MGPFLLFSSFSKTNSIFVGLTPTNIRQFAITQPVQIPQTLPSTKSNPNLERMQRMTNFNATCEHYFQAHYFQAHRKRTAKASSTGEDEQAQSSMLWAWPFCFPIRNICHKP